MMLFATVMGVSTLMVCTMDSLPLIDADERDVHLGREVGHVADREDDGHDGTKEGKWDIHNHSHPS